MRDWASVSDGAVSKASGHRVLQSHSRSCWGEHGNTSPGSVGLFTVQEQELRFRHIQAKGQRVTQVPDGGQSLKTLSRFMIYLEMSQTFLTLRSCFR